MCQTSRPWPGSEASKPSCWRFSTRKYSLPSPPSFHSRYAVRLVLTSEMVTSAFVVGEATSIHPWVDLHQAEGCTGRTPPRPQDPDAIRHQLPIPSEVLSVS